MSYLSISASKGGGVAVKRACLGGLPHSLGRLPRTMALQVGFGFLGFGQLFGTVLTQPVQEAGGRQPENKHTSPVRAMTTIYLVT